MTRSRHLITRVAATLTFAICAIPGPVLAQPYDFKGEVGEPFYSGIHEEHGATTKQEACEVLANALSFYVNQSRSISVENIEETYVANGQLDRLRYDCKFEHTNYLGETITQLHRADLHCRFSEEQGDVLERACRPEPTPLTCLESGNPIAIAFGRKVERAADWVSPIDTRFRFDRLYNSSAQVQDTSTHGWGQGWSSKWSSQIVRELTRPSPSVYSVTFGDSSILSFWKLRGVWLTDPLEKGHSYRLELNVASEGGRDVVFYANGRKNIYENIDVFTSQLSEVRWPDGYTISITYDTSNNIAAIQDNKQQRAEFTWDTTLNPNAEVPVVTSIRVDTAYDGITLAEDVEIAYTYTPFLSWKEGLLNTSRTVTDMSSGQTITTNSYEYSDGTNNTELHKLIAVSDGRVTDTGTQFNYATWTYERFLGSRVRATSSSHAGGLDLHSVGLPVETTAGYAITTTNPLGKETVYSFEEIAGQDRLVGVEGVSTVNCLPSNTTATYDRNGRKIETIERNGARTVMTRDSRGRILTRTEDADGLAPRVTTYTWTGELRKPLSRTTAELQETFTYDANSLLTSRSQTDVLAGSPDNGKVRTWTYTYTTLASGLKVLTSLDGPGLAADGVNDVTTYTYNARGQLLTTADPNGLMQEVLSYGISGQPTLIRDHKGFEWALEYDLAGRLLKSTFEPGVLNEETTYSYDIIGQMLSSTDALGRTWSYSYDEARRLVQITAPSGETIDFGHDAMGNVTRTEYADAAAVAAYLAETQYDELGRILQAIGSNGQTTSFAHDVEDNLSSITDANNLTTTNSYDALNRMTDIVDRANGTTTMAHDVDNQMTSYTDPRGIETAFDFNGFGDMVREVSADRGTMTYSYNSRGMVTAMTDGRGIVTNYAYDDGGRLVSKTFPADPSLDQTFVYHSNPAQPHNLGGLASVTDQTGRTDYSNDPIRGAFFEDLREIGSASYSTTYTSDAGGQTTQIDYPSGSQLLFSYDADGDITGLQWQGFDPTTGTLTGPVDVVSTMTYKPHGPLTSLTYGDGGVMTASYDSSYRLTGLLDIRSGTTLRDETYNWTNRNNLGGVTDNLDSAQTQTFDYSPREFLASADGAWGEFDWLYDSVGNRTEQMSLVAGTPLVDIYSYWPDTNQLDNVLLSTGVERRFTYDGAGNVIATNRGALAQSYTYDAANRMSSFAVNGVVQAQYQYNSLGQQVVRHLTVAGQTIHSVHDAAGNRIAEYDYDAGTGTSTLIREYIWAAGMNVAVVENGQLYFVRTDHIGRPVFATDDTGAKAWEATYLPFGGVHTSTGPNSNLRFPGQWFQSETGLHQNWMRDYDPTTGRYMQADPLGLVDGASIYGYASQNPGRYVDPKGLKNISEGGFCGAACASGFPAMPIRPPAPIVIPKPRPIGPGNPANTNGPPSSSPKPGLTPIPVPIQPRPQEPTTDDDDCENKCEQLIREIESRADNLQRRLEDLVEDPEDLYNTARTVADDWGKGSWEGHIIRFNREQSELRTVIAQADAKGCPVSEFARYIAHEHPPSRPGYR